MALCDYYLCDVCGRKAFYDSSLNYDFDAHVHYGCGSKLERVGDMAVICEDCSKTHQVKVSPKEAKQ